MGSTYQEAGQNTPRHALAANPADPREMSAGSQTSKISQPLEPKNPGTKAEELNKIAIDLYKKPFSELEEDKQHAIGVQAAAALGEQERQNQEFSDIPRFAGQTEHLEAPIHTPLPKPARPSAHQRHGR